MRTGAAVAWLAPAHPAVGRQSLPPPAGGVPGDAL